LILEGLAMAASLAFAVPQSTPSVQASLLIERQQTLDEMRTRRIIETSSDTWKPGDLTMLRQMQQAETAGAIGYMKTKVGTLHGLTVWHRDDLHRVRWLTKSGFEKYMFFRSQDARAYFEDHEVSTSLIFEIRTADGEEVFNSDGILTEAGDRFYNRILGGDTVSWTDPNGRVMDNRPFRPESGKK
jgi:hypothetical protein